MPDFDPFSWRSLAQSMRPPRESTRLCRRFRDSRLQARSGCAMIIGKRSIPNSAPRIGGPPIDTSQASRPERQRRAKLIPACCNVVRLASSEASRQSPKCKGRRANLVSIAAPLLAHLDHDRNWQKEPWLENGRRMLGCLPAADRSLPKKFEALVTNIGVASHGLTIYLPS